MLPTSHSSAKLPSSSQTLDPLQSKGIFSHTEINLHTAESTTRLLLPRIGSYPSIPSASTARVPATAQYKTPSGMQTVATPARQMKKRLTKGPEMRATKSQHLISFEGLDQDIQKCSIHSEFTNELQNPKSLTERLRKVENSRQVAKELNLASQIVNENLTKYNGLHSQVLVKTARLKELKAVLETLDPSGDDAGQIEEAMNQLQAELDETLQGLRNETHYQETLEGMLETRKISLREKKKPITYLKTEIAGTDQVLRQSQQEVHKAEKALAGALKEYDEIQAIAEKKKAEHKSSISQEIHQYKDKQKLLLYLKKEHEEIAESRHQATLKGRVQDLERQMKIEKVSEEVKQIEQHSLQEEKKFKKIQSTTNITSVVDMEPYWRYLSENRERLEKSVENAERQIEELTRERETAKRDLKSLVVDPDDDSLLSIEEIGFMEERLKVKVQELEDNENNLQRIDDLIAGATNSVSLISFQVFPDHTLDVKPSNTAEYLLTCAKDLGDKLLEVVAWQEKEQTQAPVRTGIPERRSKLRKETNPAERRIFDLGDGDEWQNIDERRKRIKTEPRKTEDDRRLWHLGSR